VKIRIGGRLESRTKRDSSAERSKRKTRSIQDFETDTNVSLGKNFMLSPSKGEFGNLPIGGEGARCLDDGKLRDNGAQGLPERVANSSSED